MRRHKVSSRRCSRSLTRPRDSQSGIVIAFIPVAGIAQRIAVRWAARPITTARICIEILRQRLREDRKLVAPRR